MKTSASILEEQPFMRGMNRQQLELLAADSMFVEFEAGERILHEGSHANRFYLILQGRVALEATIPGTKNVPLQTLGAGDVLGWSWLFPPYYWHFDAHAITPAKAIFFYGTHLRELCEENHDFGYELMKRISCIVIKRLQAARRELVAQNKDLPLPI